MKKLRKKTVVMIRKTLVTLLIAITFNQLVAQHSDTLSQLNRKRLNTLILSTSASYSIALVGLNNLWYKNSERESFHFFNDNAEWNQVDKLGHFYTAFYLSYGSSKALNWAGVNERKSNLWGAAAGLALLIPIEILDGYSSAYGASYGDLIANASGSVFYLGQTLLWNEIRIYPKFSFHTTRFASIRPNVLGDQFINQLLKDYNGQTYWLSFDVDKFATFPKWLNLSVGYGGEEMVYARYLQNTEAGFNPYRQLYFSLDFDLSSIRTKSKFVKSALFFLNMIKLPSPTIEFSKRGSKFHPFYF